MKKTEKHINAQRICRKLTVMLLLTGLLFAMGITAHASSTSSDASIQAMNSKIYTIYLLIRNDIAFPLLSLSFASCGFKILGAGITGSGNGIDKGFQAAKEQIVTSVMALLLLLALPYLISTGIALFKRNAWVPPGTVLLPVPLMGGCAIW